MTERVIQTLMGWAKDLVRRVERLEAQEGVGWPQWDDLRVDLSTAKTVGSSNLPVFTKLKDDGAGSAGVYAWAFGDGDQIFFTVQMPHGWKVGSTIYPHAHWMPLTDVSPADNVKLTLEYSWVDIDEDMGNTTIYSREASTGENNAYRHMLTEFRAAGLDGTGHTLSSVLVCRVLRQAADTDNYAGDIAILDVDFHYELDTIGSRTASAK